MADGWLRGNIEAWRTHRIKAKKTGNIKARKSFDFLAFFLFFVQEKVTEMATCGGISMYFVRGEEPAPRCGGPSAGRLFRKILIYAICVQ